MNLCELALKIIDGYRLSRNDDLSFFKDCNLDELTSAADKIREHFKLAAGRKLLSENGKKAFLSGASATITGNMLTTSGSTINGDNKMLSEMGRSVKAIKGSTCDSCDCGCGCESDCCDATSCDSCAS